MLDRPEQVIINQFGEKLRDFRLAKGWKQEELADAAGVSLNTVSRVETGANEAGLVTIVRLAAALEIDPGELFVLPR